MHQKQDTQEPPQQSTSGAKDRKPAIKDDSAANSAPMATIQDDDERLLAQIGYKQVCSVCRNVPSVVSLQISCLARTLHTGVFQF